MNKFHFVTPMFNASKTLARMLHSICGQSYDNWRLTIIDDVSSKEEVAKCYNLIWDFKALSGDHLGKGYDEEGEDEKIKVIWNKEKKWEVANVLAGMARCTDDEIVCRIDADDWLTDLDALAIIDSVYQQTSCDILWTAHRWAYSDKNISGPMPNESNPYTYPWVSSHLKTFRKSLLNGTNDVNFRGADGEYIKRAGDQAIYLPALHNSNKRIFVPRVMYHYTIDDVPETYGTADAKFQYDEAQFLRSRGYVK